MAYNGMRQQNQVRGDNGRQGRMFPPPGRRKDWRQRATGIARQPPVSVGRSESSAPSRQRPKSASPSSRERGRLNMVSRLALSCWDRALARPYEERTAGAGQQNPIVCEWDKGTVPLSHSSLPFAGRASPSGIPKSQRGFPRCPGCPVEHAGGVFDSRLRARAGAPSSAGLGIGLSAMPTKLKGKMGRIGRPQRRPRSPAGRPAELSRT